MALTHYSIFTYMVDRQADSQLHSNQIANVVTNNNDITMLISAVQEIL